MNGYTWMLVGASKQIPVLVSESVVVDRMVASAEKYRLLSNLQAREPVQAVVADDAEESQR